jgi:hypothetical protein
MFSEALQVDLELTFEDGHLRIPAGSIKNFQVDLYSYGFDAQADFWISADVAEDKLFPKFTKLDQIEAWLSIRGVYNLPSPAPDPLTVKGLVTWKSVSEVAFEKVKGHPVLLRHYTIHFQDVAQVLWRQHFPTALYPDAKMVDVIKAQLVQGVTLQMQWDSLEKEQPMIFLSQGAAFHGASFYDFLMWYAASENGVFTYDSQENTYRLSDRKNSLGREVSFVPHEVEKVRVHLPETYRHSVMILNAYSEKPQSEGVKQDQAVAGTHRHLLLRAPIAADFESRKNLEKQRLKNREHEIELVLNQFPLKTFRTWSPIQFDKQNWSKEVFPHGRKYRVYEIHISGNAQIQEARQELGAEFAVYDVEMKARLEQRENPHVYLPPFEAPTYPIQVEGKIVSEIGEYSDKTYQIYSDEKTSQDFYAVLVPLWNKEIRILFTPDFFTGHFYFPAYKNSRVLVALYLNHAEINRFLDWAAGVRLPMDTQGDHILFGKHDESQTSVRHAYEDDKPVLSIDRIFGVDTELIQLKEGAIILETKEDEARRERKERVDLTPRVASAQAKSQSEYEAATSELTANFQTTKSEVTGEIDEAFAEVKGQLEAMDAEISGKVGEINARVEAAMQRLAEQTSELKTRAASIKGELKEKVKL